MVTFSFNCCRETIVCSKQILASVLLKSLACDKDQNLAQARDVVSMRATGQSEAGARQGKARLEKKEGSIKKAIVNKYEYFICLCPVMPIYPTISCITLLCVRISRPTVFLLLGPRPFFHFYSHSSTNPPHFIDP